MSLTDVLVKTLPAQELICLLTELSNHPENNSNPS